MTNEQLAVLLECLADELADAIESVRDVLADQRPLVCTRVHVVEHLVIFTCNDPEHYDERLVPDPIVELQPLDGVLERLTSRIELLKAQPAAPKE